MTRARRGVDEGGGRDIAAALPSFSPPAIHPRHPSFTSIRPCPFTSCCFHCLRLQCRRLSHAPTVASTSASQFESSPPFPSTTDPTLPLAGTNIEQTPTSCLSFPSRLHPHRPHPSPHAGCHSRQRRHPTRDLSPPLQRLLLRATCMRAIHHARHTPPIPGSFARPTSQTPPECEYNQTPNSLVRPPRPAVSPSHPSCVTATDMLTPTSLSRPGRESPYLSSPPTTSSTRSSSTSISRPASPSPT